MASPSNGEIRPPPPPTHTNLLVVCAPPKYSQNTFTHLHGRINIITSGLPCSPPLLRARFHLDAYTSVPMSSAEPDTGLLQRARAHYGEERGVTSTSSSSMRAFDAFSDDSTGVAPIDPDDNISDPSLSSPRNVRIPARRHFVDNTISSGASSALQSLTSASTLSTTLEGTSGNGNLNGRFDLSPRDPIVYSGLLHEPIFGQQRDEACGMDNDSPEEMQRKDPLGTQIWKLYHKTRGQLPNSERLENLSWRMMSMNLKRRELERQGWVWTCFSLFA